MPQPPTSLSAGVLPTEGIARTPHHRLRRRGLVIGLLVMALTSAIQPQAAEAGHGCPIDETGHRGWFICETHPSRVRFDNRLHIFVHGTDHEIWYAWERWRGGPWSTWHTLGGEAYNAPGEYASPYAYIVNLGNDINLRVRVLGTDRRYYCKSYGLEAGRFWTPWYRCG